MVVVPHPLLPHRSMSRHFRVYKPEFCAILYIEKMLSHNIIKTVDGATPTATITPEPRQGGSTPAMEKIDLPKRLSKRKGVYFFLPPEITATSIPKAIIKVRTSKVFIGSTPFQSGVSRTPLALSGLLSFYYNISIPLIEPFDRLFKTTKLG